MAEETTMTTSPDSPTAGEGHAPVIKLKELIEREKQERVGKCAKEVGELLQKHNCSLDVSITFSQSRGIIPSVQIIAKE